MPPTTVLAAKLTPPRLAHAVLRRGQLEAVRQGARANVLYVQAPAGYGKTTLLAEAARRLSWDYVWYRFDVLDADTEPQQVVRDRRWFGWMPAAAFDQ